jgi:hypothetical protein
VPQALGARSAQDRANDSRVEWRARLAGGIRLFGDGVEAECSECRNCGRKLRVGDAEALVAGTEGV